MRKWNIAMIGMIVGCLGLMGCQADSTEGDKENEVELESLEEGVDGNESDSLEGESAFEIPMTPMDIVSVEIVDELYNSNEEIRVWVDSVREMAGTYVQRIENYDYILLIGGEKPTTGYGMAFIEAKSDEENIYIVYSLISPPANLGEDVLSEQPSYPFMLLRVMAQDELTINPYFVDESQLINYLEQTNN